MTTVDVPMVALLAIRDRLGESAEALSHVVQHPNFRDVFDKAQRDALRQAHHAAEMAWQDVLPGVSS